MASSGGTPDRPIALIVSNKPAPALDVIPRLRAEGKRILISFGGGDMKLADYAGVAGRVDDLADAIAGFVSAHGFDGVDIDFEVSAAPGARTDLLFHPASKSITQKEKRSRFCEIRERKQMHSQFKATLAGAVSAVAMFSFGAAALAESPITPQEQALIAGAKAEGEITIIHPLFSDRTTQRMGEAFARRYGLGDDFKFNSLRKGTGATVAQVRQEIQANKFTVDLILVHSPAFFDQAASRNAFLELDSGNWKDSTRLVEAAGQYSRYPYVVTPLAYTFQPVWNASCPGMENFNVTSYKDAVAASLSGKTISSDITKSFTYTNTVIALEQAGAVDFEDFWLALKKTDPIVEFRTEPKMQMAISCQRPFDMWNLAGRVYQNVLKSPDLKGKIKIGYYEEGLAMLGNQIAVLKGAPNPNAAKLLVEFLLTEEGSDIFVEGEAVYSFRDGYTPPENAAPYLLNLSEHKLIGMKDWVAAVGEYKSQRELWQKNFR